MNDNCVSNMQNKINKFKEQGGCNVAVAAIYIYILYQILCKQQRRTYLLWGKIVSPFAAKDTSERKQQQIEESTTIY